MILVESYSNLYRGMSVNDLLIILRDNEMKNKSHPSICFSRSIRTAEIFAGSRSKGINGCKVILEIDKNKLSNNYKVYPVSDYANNIKGNFMPSTVKSRYIGDENSKSEERVDKPIKNVLKYITMIYLDEFIKEYEECDELIELLKSKNLDYTFYEF